MYRRFSMYLVMFVLGLFLLSSCSAYRSGNRNLDQENYEAAISNYLEVISKNPNHWQARERLGFAYLKTGQLDKAVRELETALEREPGDPFGTYYLGLAYLNRNQTQKAIKIWKGYRNQYDRSVEEELRKQVFVLEMVNSLHLAKQALMEEEKLQALPPQAQTVGIFYFKDTSQDKRFRYFQKALAAMIITDLSQIKALTVLERFRVQCLLEEMKLGRTGIVDERTAPRAGRLLGAESLVVGTLEPGSMVVKTSVASASEKEVVGAFSVTGEKEKFYELQKEIVFHVLQVLHVSLTDEEEKLVSKYHTKNFEAVIYFGQGLDALDSSKWQSAKNLFKKAIEEDPEFMLARKAYAVCPGGDTPTLASLSTISQAELSEAVDSAVSDAGESGGEGGEPGPPAAIPEAPEAGTGSITVSW